MAITSDADVCNIALKRLGVGQIVNLLDGSDQAVVLNAIYANTRDRILRELEWNCAQFRVALSSDPTKTPAFGFNYAYPLPTKPLCLKVNETLPTDAIYRVENSADALGDVTGKVIVTDEGSLSIRYTGQLTDVTQWDPSLVEAVASDLAAQAAWVLTESPAKVRDAQQWAAQALAHAQTVDSQESSTRQMDINDLVDVRLHGAVADDFTRNRNVI